MTPSRFCPETLYPFSAEHQEPCTKPDGRLHAVPAGERGSGCDSAGNRQGAARGWGRVRLAAPSWVMPGTIEENCHFLADKVDEVGLLFFDTAASLAYGEADLPPNLATLGLAFHVHLPGNLPWGDGGVAVAAACVALMDKVAFLGATQGVLHPPADGAGAIAALNAFGAAWRAAGRNPADILLENTRENTLGNLWPCIGQNGFGVCLDLGHMLAYDQEALCRDAFIGALPLGRKADMIHYNAPGVGPMPVSGHAPLDSLDAAGCRLGQAMCSLLDEGGVAMAEFFVWEHVALSLPLMDSWLRQR